MQNLDLFQSQKLRDIGVMRVYISHSTWVDEAREVAKKLARNNGQVSSDEVLDYYPRPDDVHPNATGSIFREKCWKRIGYKQSERPSAHARVIGIYQLIKDTE